jgi:hypothetical protein
MKYNVREILKEIYGFNQERWKEESV